MGRSSIATAAARPCAEIAENLTCGATDAAMWTPKPSALPAPMTFRSTRGAAKDRRLKTIRPVQKPLRAFLSQGGVMKEFDEETLSQFDGREGRPCYIAHGDRVIDVSASKLWKTGSHMKRHSAGNNLTQAIGAAPHGTDVLDKYPQVGIFKRRTRNLFCPRLWKRSWSAFLFCAATRTRWSFIFPWFSPWHRCVSIFFIF